MTQDLKWKYVRMEQLEYWVGKYAKEYKMITKRLSNVSLIECADQCVAGAWTARLIFVVTDNYGKHIATLRIYDALNARSCAIDDVLMPIHARSVSRGDYEIVKLIHAARYHIGRTVEKICSYCDSGNVWLLCTSYLWPVRCQMRMMRANRKVVSDCVALARVKSLLSWFSRANPESNEGSYVTASATPTAPSIILTPEEMVDNDRIMEEMRKEESTRSKFSALVQSDAGGVAGRNRSDNRDIDACVVKAVDRTAVKTEQKIKSRSIVARAVTAAESRIAMGVVSNDVPCFHLVNSNVRSLPGYARVQIGGRPDANFVGKYVPDRSLVRLREEICSYVVDLKAANIRNVLLSGTVWTPDCPLSGEALNSDLPKWFDGINVKLIASARYGKKTAALVREYHAKVEQPYIEDDAIVYDDDEMFKDDVENDAYEEVVCNKDLTAEWAGTPDLDLLQIQYEDAFPKSAYVDQVLKQQEFHLSGEKVEMPEIALRTDPDEDFDDRVFSETSYMSPNLVTHLEMRHPVNQRELVNSVFNRNYMPPKEDTIATSLVSATKLYGTFVSCLKRLPASVNVSDAEISNYIQRKGAALESDLKRLVHEIPQDVDSWNALVKGVAKPVLNDDDADKYAPTQVIICKDKLYNVRFGPFLSCLKDRLIRDFKDNVFVFSEDSNDGFQRTLTRKRHFMKGNIQEVDMSKYDKSQGLTALLLDCMIFLAYGADMDDVRLWLASHWYARVKSMTGFTKFKLPAQRKSGDPWTYYGNTLFLLCVLKYSVQQLKGVVNFIMVSGDDSLIWSTLHRNSAHELVDVLARDYNLDAKLIKAKSLYFCSRFMIEYNNNIYLVPDPVKILIKLGKKDVRDRGHMEELRVALYDQIDQYRYLELRETVAEEMRDRYNVDMVEDLMSTMFALAISPNDYASLFGDNENSTKMAILVPFDASVPVQKRYVFHDALVRKDIARFDMPKLCDYMRQVGKNAGKRILLTYKPEFVPQGTRILADMSKHFSLEVFEEIISRNYRD